MSWGGRSAGGAGEGATEGAIGAAERKKGAGTLALPADAAAPKKDSASVSGSRMILKLQESNLFESSNAREADP